MSLFSRWVDERFRENRRRSTSIAGLAGAVAAWGLLEYRWLFRHQWSWDLFAVLAIIAVVKIGLMIWYSLTK